jgi:hypothetical protein
MGYCLDISGGNSMKNSLLIFLMSVWALVYASSAVGAFLDARETKHAIKEMSAELKENINASYSELSYSQSANSDSVEGANPQQRFYSEQTNENQSISISPYWFFGLKIIILLAVLAWDTQEKEKSLRK